MATNPKTGGAEFEGVSGPTDKSMADKPPANAGCHDRPRLNILIQSLNYAPELTGIGNYTDEMTAWLAARGHDVHVITGLPHYPEWVVLPKYRGRGLHCEMLNGTRVLRAPHLVPAPWCV